MRAKTFEIGRNRGLFFAKKKSEARTLYEQLSDLKQDEALTRALSVYYKGLLGVSKYRLFSDIFELKVRIERLEDKVMRKYQKWSFAHSDHVVDKELGDRQLDWLTTTVVDRIATAKRAGDKAELALMKGELESLKKDYAQNYVSDGDYHSLILEKINQRLREVERAYS